MRTPITKVQFFGIRGQRDTHDVIAKQWGVSVSTVKEIKRHKSWKDWQAWRFKRTQRSNERAKARRAIERTIKDQTARPALIIDDPFDIPLPPYERRSWWDRLRFWR